MADSPKVTIDHKEIRAWAQMYHGQPQMIGFNGSATIRIDFPGKGDDTFLSDDHPPRKIDWDEFVAIFEDRQLAFIYDSRENLPDPSSSYHFIRRDSLAQESEADDKLFA